MKNQSTSNWQTRLPLTVLTAIMFLVTVQIPLAAQNQPRKYKPGERVEMDGGEVYEIIRCHGDGEWDECEYQAYFNNKPSGSPNRMTIRNLRASEERLRLARERAARSGGGAGSADNTNNGDDRKASNTPQKTPAPPAPQKNERTTRGGAADGSDGRWRVGDTLEVNDRAFWYPAQIIATQGGKYKVHFEGYPSSDDKWVDESRMRPAGGHKVAAECTYEPPGAAVTGQSRFSEALAKRKIYDEHNRKVNGTVSAPLKLGVVFLSFQTGASYKNTVANVPGDGAQRRHGGAPVGATVYTFTSRRMICEQYRDGVTRRLVEGTSACFIDKDGSWTCPSENDTKITQLDQD